MGGVGRRVVVRAPGKINLSMRVGPPGDDGYHDVATVYQAVGLTEELTAEPADALSLAFEGPIATAGLPVDGSNLVLRAARLLQARTGHRGGARIRVLKRVPIAGGMGGGSADAAAAVVALDHLWGLGLGAQELLAIGAELGADVPFAMTGGTAVGTGRGEVLTPVLTAGAYQWVLGVAERGLSTPAVYRELDVLRAAAGETPTEAPAVDAAVLHALRSGDPVSLAGALHNDLQAAALHLRPALADLLALGLRNGAIGGLVSGSGPTVAFLAPDLDGALSLQIALSAAQHTALRAGAPAPGARLV